ncbi:MAG: IS1380 family transposase [Chloroflexi bacterium]|nr:IS1380 family transposase [Chloroflexota bacterium]
MPQSIAFDLTASRLDVSFDGPQLTSDGGLCWLSEADTALGLCAALAAHIPEWRRGSVHHSLEALVRQRVFQIACGYEDQDDADTLRSDPLLKLVCGRLPEGPDLASQPTLSRLENAVDAKACYRLALALLRLYLQERGRDGLPKRIVLDFDGTDDPAHGKQEGVAYHGFYGQHMYHPLLVFDGDTGQLITAVLRPGTCHDSRGAVAVLKRLVRHIRARWPAVTIELRADSGFAVPAVYDYCEAQRIPYTIGMISNARLDALAAPLAERAEGQRAETGEKVRLFDEAQYRAGTWDHERRVVVKAEALDKGLNVRFVVTTREDAPEELYTWYTRRGNHPELCIKDLKDDCFADRLSCHRFWANQFRLLLHGAAYWLLDTVRRWLARLHVPHLQLGTLRLRLIKIGGWVRQRLETVSLHLASSHPGEDLWHLLATRPGRP